MSSRDNSYEARVSRDLFDRAPKGGGTAVLFDANSDALRHYSQPIGQHSGNTAESWLHALQMARVFGRPYQGLVCLFGAITALLSATGVLIWWRKRRALQLSERYLDSPFGVPVKTMLWAVPRGSSSRGGFPTIKAPAGMAAMKAFVLGARMPRGWPARHGPG